MISFIVATYNRPKNLRVLLDCLLAQDNDDWGRWKEYRRKLENRFPGIKTT